MVLRQICFRKKVFQLGTNPTDHDYKCCPKICDGSTKDESVAPQGCKPFFPTITIELANVSTETGLVLYFLKLKQEDSALAIGDFFTYRLSKSVLGGSIYIYVSLPAAESFHDAHLLPTSV